MREIKFRSWDKKYKKMYWGNIRITSACPHNDIEIMQFTGLTDKNGVEIYEGDIIKVSDENPVHITATINADLWPEPFVITDKNIDVTIIGNIYENPELLKPSKKEK